MDVPRAVSWDALSEWFATRGAHIAVVVIAVYVAVRIVRRVVPATVRPLVLRDATPHTEVDLRKRADTLSNVLIHTATIVLLVFGIIQVLTELGFNVTPLLTGLGIGGLALGLGAQSVVRDTINGTFILLENQYGRGDLVTLGGVQGWVEEVTLRRTVVRDADGTLFSIPNSEVKVAGNHTRGYSGINLLIPLVHASDMDRAIEIINAEGAALASDPLLGPLIIDVPRAVRLEGLTATGMTLRVLGKSVPGAHVEVAGALRGRVKRAFDAAGIRFGDPPPAPPAAAGPAPAPPSTPAPPAPPPAPASGA